MIIFKLKCYYLDILLVILVISSCTRNNIEFGTIPENKYASLVYTDTVSARISTIIIDSFETNGDTCLLVGHYRDPYLGTVSAKSFFQLDIPSSIPEIPATAQFDSVTFMLRPNDYYYGDTSKEMRIQVHELANAISYSYNNKLYNTSEIAVKSPALGEAKMKIKPRGSDSIIIRLNDAKGLELFNRLQQQNTDVTQSSEFLNFFKGISISTDSNDESAIIGLSALAGSMVLRVHYHHTIPYHEALFVDFPSLANDLAFYQALSNRTGTGLVPGTTGLTEIAAEKTNGLSFSQAGTGLFLKMTFPSLRSIIGNSNIVKLLKAELLVRPAHKSFDRNKYLLPSRLYLLQTDESNIPGSEVMDSTGAAVQYVDPVVDDIYGENNFYRFNLTAYVNSMLNTAGSEDAGFFILHQSPISPANVDRLIVNPVSNGGQNSRLLLTLMIINK